MGDAAVGRGDAKAQNELYSIPNCCYVHGSQVVKVHSLFRLLGGGGGIDWPCMVDSRHACKPV